MRVAALNVAFLLVSGAGWAEYRVGNSAAPSADNATAADGTNGSRVLIQDG